MYKVVTHTIKEEHFEHPALAEKGMAVHTGGNVNPYYGNITPKMGSMRGPMRGPMRGSNADVITPGPPTDGNVKIRMPLNENWGDYEWHGEYHAWGDLAVHGSLSVVEDLMVDGTIAGRGSVSTVTVMTTEPTGNTWTGNIGELARTSSHMYLCVETDHWIRWPVQSSW